MAVNLLEMNEKCGDLGGEMTKVRDGREKVSLVERSEKEGEKTNEKEIERKKQKYEQRGDLSKMTSFD